MSDEFHVTSEIYNPIPSTSGKKLQPTLSNENVVTEFLFDTPSQTDEDGDLLVRRHNEECHVIEIEHSPNSSLQLVGRQVWRGALLLADFLLHGGKQLLKDKNVLEVGSGVGLTSIVAAMLARNVTCTDVDLGGILELIRTNASRNSKYILSTFQVMGLDFMADSWSNDLEEVLRTVSIILAADVIYDNDLTEGFVKSLVKILSLPPAKTIYVALEKRYVFTVADLDSVAPCYEHFLQRLEQARATSRFKMRQLPTDFPQYFQYERIKQLVLWEITT